MASSVVKQFTASNGNAPASAAMVGLDVLDAAYHTAHAYPGGVPALAQRMGMSQNTLAHKVSLANETHHLSLREAVAMQEVSQDKRIAQAMCCASPLPTASRTAGFPLCGPSGRLSVSLGGRSLRMGVTPSLFSRNRMW